MKKLQHLNLSSNQFDGAIPTSLGTMATLMSVDLSCNQLSGAMPFQPAIQKELMSVLLFGNDDLIGPDCWRRVDTAR